MDDTFIVSAQEAHLRLDKLLTLHFPSYSRTYFQFLIEKECILVNGAGCKKREKVKAGDEIEICFLLTPQIPLQAQPIPLDILYEDEELLIINKPASMVVHPAPGHPTGTLVNALLYHCNNLEFSDTLRPGIVHRLDKDTTGVLITAKTLRAHAHLVNLFSERKVQKKYIAICVGNPKQGLIDAPIARHAVHRQQMDVCPTRGKEAKTKVALLSESHLLSVVECTLITGRTHQIRVHMKHLGTPILGDPIYGSLAMNKKFNTSRQLLHAHSVRFTHPLQGREIEITAPLPDDMLAYLTR